MTKELIVKKITTAASELFVPRNGIYLLNHSVGCMPCSTRSCVEHSFFEAWQQGDPDAWSRWMPVFDDFKSALARLFNAFASDFCPQVNISSGLSKVIHSLPRRKGKRFIVLSENDFPSTGFVIQQAHRNGYEIRWLAEAADLLSLDTWAQVLTEDVQCVLISHVHYNTSTRTPVQAIVELARQRQIFSLVDIAQSSGVVPIDLIQWQADVVLGSCVKWLCGGPGAGFLWINPLVVEQFEPVDAGWFSHKTPFEFDIKHFQYADDASRFWGGTPSVVPFAIAANSINTIADIGVEQIAAHNRRLTRKIIDAMDPATLQTPEADLQRGGTLVLKLAHQQEIENRLSNAAVRFDARALGIRLSPHIYNSDSEIEQVIDCLRLP